MLKDKINHYLTVTQNFSPQQIIELAAKEFAGQIKFATSLGEEDQVITDMISRVAPSIELFTLDTGRLFSQTYELIARTQRRYPMVFKIYYPDTESLENMVRSKGINLFYDSVENRKQCCFVRKVEPFGRALAAALAWISGLRRDQSITRTNVEFFEWDSVNEKIKINPLAYWNRQQVLQYIEEHKLDVNPLHKEGFISIGCSPCTRAVKPGEDIRSGRWCGKLPSRKNADCTIIPDDQRNPDKKL